jgi:general secretion pathway protein L
VAKAFTRFSSPNVVRLVEESSGTFRIAPKSDGPSSTSPHQQFAIVDGRVAGPLPEPLLKAMRGSRIELVLRPAQFLFRPIEFPKQAGEFLDGIVRSQIDRLTPWKPDDAAFGWTQPVDLPNDRISVTIAATARSRVEPYVQALAELRSRSVDILTTAPDAGVAAPIKVFQRVARNAVEVGRIRRVLTVLLLIVALLGAASITFAAVTGDTLQAQQDELARQISQYRSLIGQSRNVLSGAALAEQGLQRRKRSIPSRVIVLEALSKVLPDNTFVTELRIEGDTVKVIGLTQDAPALIRLIEQSQYFTRATFFAPTTRAPTDRGENFHIEARIQPSDSL